MEPTQSLIPDVAARWTDLLPDHQPGSWYALSRSGLPGLKCVGHYGNDQLRLDDRVVVIDGGLILLGRISRDPKSKIHCIYVTVEVVIHRPGVTPKMKVGAEYLCGGFQTFIPLRDIEGRQ